MHERYTRTNILDVIRGRGWSVAYAARKLRYSREYLYRLSNGERSITPAFVERACQVLDLPPSALFFDPKPTPFRDTIDAKESRDPVAV